MSLALPGITKALNMQKCLFAPNIYVMAILRTSNTIKSQFYLFQYKNNFMADNIVIKINKLFSLHYKSLNSILAIIARCPFLL